MVQARAMAFTQAERAAIDAAAEVMGEEAGSIGVTHAGFCLTALPHKRIADPLWRREGHRVTLLVESGRNRGGDLVGVPYGSLARLILLYLQTEAIRTGSPEVELGGSMRAWMMRLTLTTGGKTYQLVTEQARRLSACRLTFFATTEAGEARHNGAFVRDAISMGGASSDIAQPSLWQEKVRLDEGFWRSLRAHPVPVREEAIRAIGTRSLAIDLYIWLAYRLHALPRATTVSWASLHNQFGAGFKHARQMKPTFLEALALATAVYPEANVAADPERGVTLHPSSPAVARADRARLGVG